MPSSEDAARLAEIQERLAKATPGPWQSLERGDRLVSWQGGYKMAYIVPEPFPATDQGANDADLIANAPADLAWLLAELAEAQQEVDRLRSSVTRLSDSYLEEVNKRVIAQTEVSGLRAALEGLPEQINALEPGDGSWSFDFRQGFSLGTFKASAVVVRSFAASRPTPAPEATR